MSEQPTPQSLAALLAGRWQIPLAVVAAIAGCVALYRLLPESTGPDHDAVLADVTILEQAGDTLAAADAVANLLELDQPLSPERRATLHDRLADLLFQAELSREDHNRGNVEKLQENSREAIALGLPSTPRATMRSAFAHQWLGESDAAIRGLRAALEQGIAGDDRRMTLRALVELLERRPEARLERRSVLEHLLEDESVSPAYFWWGLHRAVRDALDENDTLRARELLNRYGARLTNSDHKGYLNYLSAWIMLHEGRPEEAAPLVQWIDDWLKGDARGSREMDDFGHLPSLNRWLMGRVHLAEGRPQDALEAFEESLEYQPGPELRVAVQVGRGLSLGALDRHEAALESFREAVREAPADFHRRQHAIVEFQRALLSLHEAQAARGFREQALAYLSLAAELTPGKQPQRQLELFERLGRAYREVAQSEADPQRARAYHEQAAEYFERAANLVELDEPRLAELLWAAAEEYDLAGRLSAMRATLERFIAGRSDHPHMPQALLQFGRAHEAYGELEEALYWYGEVIARYPRLIEAARARVLKAGALAALGAERYADAEQVLAGLLTSDVVEPSAPEYRDALLDLCELLYYQGRYAEAISRLQDFLRLYPADEEHFRARFALADAHRRSAYALRDNPPPGALASKAVAISQERFERAAELFDELLGDLEVRAEQDDAVQAYERLALFYRGDCLFELNTPETLEDALAAYRHAAARYDAQPAALTAQVQIANVYLRLGDVTEAARAIERARWLLRSIPAEAYTQWTGGSRDDWQKYLAVVSSSNLFQGVFANAP